MKDISIYFSQVEIEKDYAEQQIGAVIQRYSFDSFPEIKEKGIALMYVPEYRGADLKERNQNEEKFR